MSLSSLPLSYCTNVHPGLTLATVRSGLREYTAEVRKRLAKVSLLSARRVRRHC